MRRKSTPAKKKATPAKKKKAPAPQNDFPPRRTITRLTINIDEAEQLTGLHKRTLQRIFKDIRKKKGDTARALVTIDEFAKVVSLSPAEVRKALGL